MKVLIAVMLLVVFAAGAAQAAGIPISGADVGPAWWQPIGDEDGLWVLDLTLKPFAKATGPDTPTNIHEILPWAKANLGIDFPFQGDPDRLLKPIGIGISESVKIGSIADTPIRAGVGWLNNSGACLFIKGAVEF